jgi:uncharacterized membrane protein
VTPESNSASTAVRADDRREAYVPAVLRGRVDSVEVSTVVYLPPADIYEFLLDFPGYANYSKYLQRVHSDGDGSPGTRYALRFAWWKITYTAHTRVTEVDPPNRIDWEVIKDIDAEGYWELAAVPDRAPPEAETATRVTLRIEFDASSVGDVDLPSFVSTAWVVEKVKPLIQDEAERIVERIVADLEGEKRPVELTIHTTPDTV